jgi:hypothetical protein
LNSLLIYTEQTTPRLTYIFDLLISDLLGLTYTLTHSKEEFAAHTGAKFSYAAERVADELFFESVKFLFEDDVKYQPLDFCEWQNLIGFFPVYKDSTVSFDVFASAFFMVTRYEEYLPHQKDKYDRYRASQSLNMKAGILEKPMVNLYAIEIGKMLQQRFALTLRKIPFRYNLTVDIDIAYSYRGKGIKRTLGGLTRSLLFSEFDEAKERIRALFYKGADPYDTYDYIFQVCDENNLQPLFFFLLGNESRFDKNISHTNTEFRKLIKAIDERYETGIHLSYKSHVSSHLAKREIARLKDITGHDTEKNRFHYLRFQLPETYSRLAKTNITQDYSMGYAPHVGFRAGICTPFRFFNVRQNLVSQLVVHPVTFMDTTFTHYYHADNEFALSKIQQLMKTVYECGGDFTGLWHNASFTERNEWKGWREIFETVARQASQLMIEQQHAAVTEEQGY